MDPAIAIVLALLRQPSVAGHGKRIMLSALIVVLAFATGGALAVAGTGLTATGSWLALRPLVGPAWASVIVGAGMLALAAALFVIGYRKLAIRRRQTPALLPSAEALACEAGRVFAEHKGGMLLSALLAGFLYEKQPFRR